MSKTLMEMKVNDCRAQDTDIILLYFGIFFPKQSLNTEMRSKVVNSKYPLKLNCFSLKQNRKLDIIPETEESSLLILPSS